MRDPAGNTIMKAATMHTYIRGEGKSSRLGLPSRHGYHFRPRPTASQGFIDPR
jgi:hypothetical protein